jgi:carbonic anhydrase
MKHLRLLAILLATQFLFSCAYFLYEDEEEQETAPIIQGADQSAVPANTEKKRPAEKSSEKPMAPALKAPIAIVEAQPLKDDPPKPIESANVKAAHDEVARQLKALQGAAPIESLANGVTPEKALGWLKNGNTRFVKHRLRTDGQSLSDIKKVASQEQKPHTVVLACSDSRVPPEILFDQKLGEIYVVRTAGESLDAASVGSLEQALLRFGTRHILILGHTHCGAIKDACKSLKGGVAESENINYILHDIGSRLQSFKQKPFSPGFADEAWANVLGVADDLPKRSGIIALMTKNKNVQISTAVYDIETGKVEFK